MKSEKELEKLIELNGGWRETECEHGCAEIKSMRYTHSEPEDEMHTETGRYIHVGMPGEKDCGGKIIKDIWHKALRKDECTHCQGTGKKLTLK
jgi:hypothetical protein